MLMNFMNLVNVPYINKSFNMQNRDKINYAFTLNYLNLTKLKFAFSCRLLKLFM